MTHHTAEEQTLTIGFDIGGTNLRGAVVRADGRIIDRTQVPTPSTAQGMEHSIDYVVSMLRDRHPDIAAVGLAVAGFLDPTCEYVRYAPHLPWRKAHVKETIEKRVGLPVRLEHDANSAAWGEYRFGAAQEESNWVLFAIGTGIGAALMNDGHIYRGAFGTAPEFGHLTVVPDGRQCSCGKQGCLERYCSGTALPDTVRELMGNRRYQSSQLVEQYKNCPDELTGRRVMTAARNGDSIAVDAIKDFSRWLGEALAIVSDVLDPRLIVIGGGVSSDSALYLPHAAQHFATRVVGAGYRPLPDLKTVELGADAGMIGVADLARSLVEA